jgi:hypothetical protein
MAISPNEPTEKRGFVVWSGLRVSFSPVLRRTDKREKGGRDVRKPDGTMAAGAAVNRSRASSGGWRTALGWEWEH